MFRAFLFIIPLLPGVFAGTREIEVWGSLSCLNKDHGLTPINKATSYLMEKDLGFFPDFHDTIRSKDVDGGSFSLYGWEAEVFGVTEYFLWFTLPCPVQSECVDTDYVEKCKGRSSVDYTHMMEKGLENRPTLVQYHMNCSIGHRDSTGNDHSGLWCKGGVCEGWCNLPL